jgi:predicted GNAT family N-acyltransferase
MEKVMIKDKEYVFVKDYKDNAPLRQSFNQLTQKTYGFDFEQWYQAGYWGSVYIPYSLVVGEKVVANVSVNVMEYMVLGEKKRYIQLGTVMTASEYRNQGLARYIIERIIEQWNNHCESIYLFANDRVLDFYPKFGFTVANEYQYSKAINNNNEHIVAEKLDMSLEANRERLVQKINHSITISKLSMVDNTGLVMFYCISFMKDMVYYLKDQDCIAIAEIKQDTLYLQDIFSSSELDLDEVIKSLTNKDVKKVVLGFAPNNIDGYCINLLNEEDSTLFMIGDKQQMFETHKLMFPVLSHA